MKTWLIFLTATVAASSGPRHLGEPGAAVAAPRIIMFHSGVLQGRRYMTTFDENMRFMAAIAAPVTTTHAAVAGSPFIEVALFWHTPTWEAYATDTAWLRTLRPESAQPARLYLGGGQHAPVFDYYSAGADPGFRAITTTGLEILERHNVPVYTDRKGR